MSDCISDCVEKSNHKNDGHVAPIINKCIKQIAQKEGFQDYKVEVQDISTNGGNFMASLQTINIKGKTETAYKEISLFVKNKFKSVQDNNIQVDTIYERELFFYNELAKIYDELQDEANIPVDERLRMVKSYNESNFEAIILENLIKKGYTTPHRLEPISLQFAEMSVKQLAKFHALSFVLKCKKPEYYEKKIKPFTYPVEVCTEWEDYVVNACTAAANCLDDDLKVRLEKFKEKIVQVYRNYYGSPSDKSTCLCHGDFRANNILMKEEEGDIKDLIVVDYQTMRYGSPVTDFIYFVFTGSDQEFRRAHLDELKELYNETLKKFLSEFGIEVQDVYPKKQFEQEYRDYLDIGLTLFLIIAPFLLCSADDIPDLQKDSSVQDNILPLDEFYEREVFYYNELSTIYDELQDEVNIPVDERLRKAKSYNESNSEAIILENLSKKGYTTPNRLEPISLQFAEMSIKQLAKFHALSFVLKSKRPEYYEMKVKPFIYPVKVNKEWEDYVVTACATAANCLDSDLKVRLENFKENIVQVYKNFVSYPADKSTCLCHGDFRANNILMKEEEGDIKDLIVVDYQTMRYGSPVTDFIYFVFTGSDQKFRRAYLDELKELYYETLERFMGEFGVEVHDVYPKKRFEQEYRDSLVIGLTIFLIGAPFMLCSDDDVPDLQKDTVSKINLNFDNAVCKERLRGIVEDFTQWGYL
ncbi:unnamed protein product [Chilo suppressalis]|uniref:CHK kinase-like domain-containing protein n=1 Tax=Chilo suppressalis TaxID=168631 RepID=A0ABN8AZH5_CHISP|nr:unnamed protein product [Chilo suppressalis]